MKNVFRNFSVVILVLFAISMTGCLSSKTEQAPKNNVNKPVVDPTQPEQPKPPVITDTSKLPVYVPSDKERPQLIKFQAPDINSNIVQKGQVVKFAAEALTSKYPATIEYSATGGRIDSNGNWTAPEKTGFYTVMAYAVDKANNLKSDPMMIEMRVAKEGNTGIILASAPAVKKDGASNGPKRAITVDDQSTAEDVSKYILNTNVAGATGTTATIELQFDDTNGNHIIAPSFEYGTLTFLGEVKNGNTYTASYKYTSPATVPTSGRANIEFNIYNPTNSDSDTATISFIINTQPVITTIEFTTGSLEVIGLGAKKTIKVTASDADQSLFGDKLTFTYTLISGSGSLSTGDGGTNTTGEVDFTAPNSAQKVLLLVLVQDTRGASMQKTFTINVQNPMSLVVADDDVAGTEVSPTFLNYAEATGDNAAKYRLLTSTVGTSQVELAIGNSANLGDTLANGGLDDAARFYFKDTSVERTSQNVVWTVYNEYSTATAIKGPDNTFLGSTGLAASMTSATGGDYNFYPGANAVASTANKLGRGGYKTIQAKVTAGVENITATDRVRVNEFPYITAVNYVDSQGNTQSLFNGTTVNLVQVPRGQTFYMNISVADFDNEKVNPDTTTFPIAGRKGFFINQANGGLEAKAGIEITNNATALNSNPPLVANRQSGFVGTVATAGVTITPPTYKANYSTAFNEVKFVVDSAATGDPTGQYHYAYLHVTDGWGQDVNADVVGGSTVDFYRVGYEMALANSTDTGSRGLDIGTVAGRTSYNRNLMLEFVDVSGVVTAKIKDIDTNTYWTKADGTVITIPMSGTFGDGSLATVANKIDFEPTVDAINESTEWLAIDFNDADKANWKAGDKVYFKTYANTVVVKYQIVEGALISAVDAPQYVTLGDTVEIKVAGTVSGTSTSASVTITENNNASGGKLEAGTDSDGDAVTNEVWKYTAPTTWPASKFVNLTVSIRDAAGNVTQRPLTIELNRKPDVTGVKDTDGMSVISGDYWILKGVNNLKLLADATDPDGAGDVLKYDWGLSSRWGTLSNLTQPVTYWSPIVAPVAYTDALGYLKGNAGPLGDGKIPFSVAARDFDKNNQPKGGYSGLKSFSIGINEAPAVGTLDPTLVAGFVTQPGAVPSTATVDFNTNSQYPDAMATFKPASLNDSLVDKNNLKFQWYVKDNATGLMAQNIGSFYTTATQVTDGGTGTVNAQKYNWIPSADVRKNGGSYTVVARVADQKTGAAKGITETANVVTITGDTTAPTGTVTAEWIVEKGTIDGIGKIGDKIRYKLAINQATAHDAVSGRLDIQKFIDGATVNSNVFRDMIYSDNNTPLDYTDDYIYYDVEIKGVSSIGGLPIANAGDANAGVQGTDYVDSANIGALQSWFKDISGNETAYAGVAPAQTGLATATQADINPSVAVVNNQNIGVDNFIGADDLALVGGVGGNIFQNVNKNTLKTKAANWITIGDSLVNGWNAAGVLLVANPIVVPIWQDSTTAYTNANIDTYAKLDMTKLGRAALIPAEASTGTTAEWTTAPIVFAEQKDATYAIGTWNTAADAKALGLFKVTITDDAGNMVEKNLYGPAGWGIDLKRPEAKKVTMYSYSYGTDGVLGGADDKIVEKDGTATTLTANQLVGAGANANISGNQVAADALDSTMELMCIEFDEDIDPLTLNDISFKINIVSTPKQDISSGTVAGTVANPTGATANNNMFYDVATKKLWIALVDNTTANKGLNVARDTVIEILFTDNSVATTGPNNVICDAHGNEIDFTRDFSDGQLQGYLQW